MKKTLVKAKNCLSKIYIEVECDKVIASGDFDATLGKYGWALSTIVESAILDLQMDVKIANICGDNRIAGNNKVWIDFQSIKNDSEQYLFTEEEAENLDVKLKSML